MDVPRDVAIERERTEIALDLSRLGSDWNVDDFESSRGWVVRLFQGDRFRDQSLVDDQLDALRDMRAKIHSRQT
jgi:hypothetical protein